MSKPKREYRSGFESRVANSLKSACPAAGYEDTTLPYTLTCKYIPDFTLPNGVFVEAKGYFTSEDRTKLKAVKLQNPGADVRILFQNASVKLSKASKTTYGDWATKNGFIWAEGTVVPKAWYTSTTINME